MKSSWKRQRQAAKNKQIKFYRWRNNFFRKYGVKSTADLYIRVRKAMRSIADSVYMSMKQIIESSISNEKTI